MQQTAFSPAFNPRGASAVSASKNGNGSGDGLAARPIRAHLPQGQLAGCRRGSTRVTILTPERERILREHYDRSVRGSGRRVAALLGVTEQQVSKWALEAGLRGRRGTPPPVPPRPSAVPLHLALPCSTPLTPHRPEPAADGATPPATAAEPDSHGTVPTRDHVDLGQDDPGRHPQATTHHTTTMDTIIAAPPSNPAQAGRPGHMPRTHEDQEEQEQDVLTALVDVYGGEAPPPPLPAMVVRRLNVLVESVVVSAVQQAATRVIEERFSMLLRELDDLRRDNEQLRQRLRQVAALVGDHVLAMPSTSAQGRDHNHANTTPL